MLIFKEKLAKSAEHVVLVFFPLRFLTCLLFFSNAIKRSQQKTKSRTQICIFPDLFPMFSRFHKFSFKISILQQSFLLLFFFILLFCVFFLSLLLSICFPGVFILIIFCFLFSVVFWIVFFYFFCFRNQQFHGHSNSQLYTVYCFCMLVRWNCEIR